MNYWDKMRMARQFDNDEDYGERGGYSGSGSSYGQRGGYGERDGYGERGDMDQIEKAICKGIKHGMKKAMEELEDMDDENYGERRGVRGTGPYSRVRHYR